MVDPSGSAWLWTNLAPVLVSPFAGSFLGVLITRLPTRAPVVFSRSACPHCGTSLTALDLVPLASFLALRGSCRHCRAPLSWFYPAVELAALAVAVCATLADPDEVWIACGLGWTLLALAWIDWTDFLLPDALTLPLLLAGLGLTLVQDAGSLTDHCAAAIVGYLSFAGLAFAYRRLRGRDGLGGGDAKLIASAGAWCGLAALPFVVLGSALLGLLAALGLALAGRTMTSTTRIPLGPCISLAFWVIWLLGPDMQNLIGRPY